MNISVQRATYDAGNGWIVNFFDGSQWIGTACTADYNGKEDSFLHSVCVNKPFRGLGWGDKILSYMVSVYGTDTLYVGAENSIAIHLYQKHGFAITETFLHGEKEFKVMRRSVDKAVSNGYR